MSEPRCERCFGPLPCPDHSAGDRNDDAVQGAGDIQQSTDTGAEDVQAGAGAELDTQRVALDAQASVREELVEGGVLSKHPDDMTEEERATAISHMALQIIPMCVNNLITPLRYYGADTSDHLVALESVIIGVLLNTVVLGGDEAVMDTISKHVKERIAPLRLQHLPVQGTS